jgi:hypothetical protein
MDSSLFSGDFIRPPPLNGFQLNELEERPGRMIEGCSHDEGLKENLFRN